MGETSTTTSNLRRTEPIAVIGMACRFPKAPDVATFSRLLCDGVDAIAPMSVDRRRGAETFSSASFGGFLDRVDLFDPSFFGISPREAVVMDPQQRLVLELAWESLEDAGIPSHSLEDSQTGVFIGAMWNDYGRHTTHSVDVMTQHTATGQDLSIIAGRVSYAFGLRGPSVVLNTASSSSLVAVHYAAKSLILGECDIALAGGVNLQLAAESTAMMSKFGATAQDGRSKAFDARADGYGRGEGAGIVVLKPLSRALADGDPIHAVILGSAVNNDGMSHGLSAPSPKAQELVLRSAYRNAGVDPRNVFYVEAHGSGTKVGDPIEASAIGAVFGDGRAMDRPLRVGSVKTNIGHLEAASGIAGFIKAVLVTKHGIVPPNLHFEQPNPEISFESLRIRVSTALEAMPEGERRLAGVSSFGFGGTNCHVVVEGIAEKQMACASTNAHLLLPLSAHDPAALRDRARMMAEFLRHSPDITLDEIVYTAALRRSHLACRLGVVGASKEEMAEALLDFASGDLHPNVVTGKATQTAPKVVFVFPGQGSQWVGMGRQLFKEEPAFREMLLACDEAIRNEAGFSIVEELDKPEETSRLGETVVAQPALFAIEIALVALLRSWGIVPSAVIGHSVGEIAAAHVAGIHDLASAARLVVLRGRVMQKATGFGKMVSVPLSEHDARKAIAGREDRVDIAAVNDPTSVVLSGDVQVIDDILEQLSAAGVETHALRVNYAFHSPQMDSLIGEFVDSLGSVVAEAGSIPMISTVTDEPLHENPPDAVYWSKNIRQTVRFAKAVAVIASSGRHMFVEVGPHPVLTMSLEQTLARENVESRVIPTLRRGKDEQKSALLALGALHVQGYGVDWKQLVPAGGRVVELPTYPWQRERYWIESAIRTTWRVETNGREETHAGNGSRTAVDEHADLRQQISRAGSEEGLALIERFLLSHVGRILRTDSSRIDPHASFVRLGLDSLMMFELRNGIQFRLGVDLGTMTLRQHGHLEALAKHLHEQLTMNQVLAGVRVSVDATGADEEMDVLTL